MVSNETPRTLATLSGSETRPNAHRHSLLLLRLLLRAHARHVVLAHLADVVLQLTRLLVLRQVRFPLPRRVGGEPDALVLAVDRVLPLGEPRHLQEWGDRKGKS